MSAENLQIRIAGKPLEELKRRAQALQVGKSTLARALIIQALNASNGADVIEQGAEHDN